MYFRCRRGRASNAMLSLNQAALTRMSSDELIVCSIEDCYEAATLAGCCRPDGFCGLLETGLLGKKPRSRCISRDSWIEHADGLDHPAIPIRCD